MNPLARSIEELLPVRVSNSVWCFVLLRTTLVISSVCAAFLLPVFGKVLEFDFMQILVLVSSYICETVKGIKISSENQTLLDKKNCLLCKFHII
jgi:hypothetical protein